MARLSLSLLGPMQVTLDDQPVTGLAYDKVRALLAFLAVEADRPHRRDALLGLLWPDLPGAAARNNLRQALGTLRHALADAGCGVPFLLVSRETIQFNPVGDYCLDVTALAALLDACARHPHRHPDRCASCSKRREQAVALYRGDFLQEFSLPDSVAFDEWALLKREGLHRRVVEALVRLACYHERRGANAEALHYARRLVALEPWHEAGQRQVMRLLWHGGQRTAALVQYERCRRLLAEELGVEPEDETTTLYEGIRAGKLAQAIEDKTQIRRHTLPLQPTAFLGREVELAQLRELLENPACRLITVTGPGGIGKTRLALAAATDMADDFGEDAWFVALAPLSDPALVAPTIAQVLGIQEPDEGALVESLQAYLRTKELLLVLDNFEHVQAAAPLVAALLAAAPNLHVLVTSRTTLQLAGEHQFPVPPMAVPHPRAGYTAELLGQYGALALFIERARAVRPGFDLLQSNARAVAEICARLDGLPLAIELAAARTKLFAPEALLQRLERRFDVLRGGPRDAPARHQTLRAAVDWSYDLLEPLGQQLFRWLAVFVGGWTVEACEAICSGSGEVELDVTDGLQMLLDASLIEQIECSNGKPRFMMLETMREYAEERLLASSEAHRRRQRHAAYYLSLAETADMAMRAGQVLWVERVKAENNNLRAALQWFVTQGEAEEGLRLGSAMAEFWMSNGYAQEGSQWLRRLLALDGAGAPTAVRARALIGRGLHALHLGDARLARALFEESSAISRTLSDEAGLSIALDALGTLAHQQGDLTSAAAHFEASLARYRALSDSVEIARLLRKCGLVAAAQRNFKAARSFFLESAAMFGQDGNTSGRAWVLNSLAELERAQGNFSLAGVYYEDSLALFREMHDNCGTAMVLTNKGAVALAHGEAGRAAMLFVEGLRLYQEVEYVLGQIYCVAGFAGVARVERHMVTAARLLGAVEALVEASGLRLERAEADDYHRNVAEVRAQLDDAAYAAAWDAGRAMTLEQVITYALAQAS